MPVVELPHEELPAFPGRYLRAFYSTSPVDLYGLMKEVDAFDCVVIAGVGGLIARAKEPDETVAVGDVILFNINHSIQPTLEERLRKNYLVVQEIQNGYKIREIPATLIFEEDVPEVCRIIAGRL